MKIILSLFTTQKEVHHNLEEHNGTYMMVMGEYENKRRKKLGRNPENKKTSSSPNSQALIHSSLFLTHKTRKERTEKMEISVVKRLMTIEC